MTPRESGSGRWRLAAPANRKANAPPRLYGEALRRALGGATGHKRHQQIDRRWRRHETPRTQFGDEQLPGLGPRPALRPHPRGLDRRIDPAARHSWRQWPRQARVNHRALRRLVCLRPGRGVVIISLGAAPCRDESRDGASANRPPESFINGLVFTLKGLALAR